MEITTTIQCDYCPYHTKIEGKDVYKFINKPCPECGENLLTEDDLDNYITMRVILDNSIKESEDKTESDKGGKMQKITFTTHKEITYKIEDINE